MATELTFTRHLEGVREAMIAFVRYADRAGLRASVPTCPDWSVRRLVAHQGMVHRWAAGALRGERIDPRPAEQAGIDAADPLEWLRDGAIDLVTDLTRAPEDLDALVFLADAPPAKRFWARRQCHETTIHAVDALSAQLERFPRSGDLDWIDESLALDGIDELVTGFWARRISRLRSPEPMRVLVVPTGCGRGWRVDLDAETIPVTVPLDTVTPGEREGADVLLEGSPQALYLTLWNRSDEVTPWDAAGSWVDVQDGGSVRWGG